MNLVEVHILQPVPPANLNRDDTGSPKDALFGGVRRARVSSQAQKRAVRQAFLAMLPKENLALRTRRLVDYLVKVYFPDKPEDEVRAVVRAALQGLGLGVTAQDGQEYTEYLLFLGRQEIRRLADVLGQHWDALLQIGSPAEPSERAQKPKKQRKKEAQQKVPDEVQRALERVLDGGRAVDMALFGRMLADRPQWGIEAACQVAHAISTHGVDREFDFFTAVDDLTPREETGAGMMGDVEYYSATFYRYANINLDQLKENLGGDAELAAWAVGAFLQAFILTLPSGKQNTFAAHTRPSFVALVVRKDAAPCNLVAAFEKPVRTDPNRKSLTGASVERLMQYWEELEDVYGRPEPQAEWVAIIDISDGEWSYRKDALRPNLQQALEHVLSGVRTLLGGV